MHSLIYLPIFSFFFITSCIGQNDKNIKEKSTQISNNINTLEKEWTRDFAIYPDNKNNQPDSASKVAEYLREIHEDKDGNLWFGTLDRGVARYDGNSLTYFTKEHGLISRQINGIAEDTNGNLWFATPNGVSKFDGKVFTNFTTENGLNHNSIWSILADSKGNVWVGSIKGVCRFDGEKFTNFSLPKAKVDLHTFIISKNLVWEMIEDSKGNIWFATDGLGAVKYDGESFTHLTKKDGLNTNDINSILEDSKGNFWFGCMETRVPSKENEFHYVPSNNGGLCLFDGKTFTKFPEIQGLIAKDIASIYEDKYGYIWIASKHNGLYRYDNGTFTNFMEKEGIARFNCVQSMLEDKEGNFWVGFSGGLFRFELDRFVHIEKNGPW